MLIRSNVSLDVDILNACMGEIKPIVSKEKLLTDLTYKKLNENNEKYIEKFNKIVDDLYECAVEETDIKKMAVLLKRLSSVSHSVFRAEMDLYKKLGEKND